MIKRLTFIALTLAVITGLFGCTGTSKSSAISKDDISVVVSTLYSFKYSDNIPKKMSSIKKYVTDSLYTNRIDPNESKVYGTYYKSDTKIESTAKLGKLGVIEDSEDYTDYLAVVVNISEQYKSASSFCVKFRVDKNSQKICEMTEYYTSPNKPDIITVS